MKKYELINKSFISFLIFFVFLSFIFIFIFFKFNFLFVSFLFFLILFTLGGRVGLNKGGQKYFFYIILNAMVLYFFAVFTIVLILKSYAVFIIFPIFIYTVLDYIFFEIKLEKILIKFLKEDLFVLDNNYDGFSSDFELEHGKVWGSGVWAF